MREQVGDKRVICGLSGGVDSSVAAALVQRAVGDQLTCVFVDHGLLRLGEAEQVEKDFVAATGVDLVVVDAKERFLEALAGISDTLATCSFALGNLPANADKANANIYLNGEVIPFDSANAKANGWGWLDAEKTNVQMYGEWCKAFKTNRKTSVVVEFGCAPVVLL